MPSGTSSTTARTSSSPSRRWPSGCTRTCSRTSTRRRPCGLSTGASCQFPTSPATGSPWRTRNRLLALASTLALPQGRGAYRALVRRKKLVLLALALVLVLSVIADLGLGPARYTMREVVLALLGSPEVSLQTGVVIWDIRMPVALMAGGGGAAAPAGGGAEANNLH